MVERVLLDACVLYPRVLRRIILGAAAAGLCAPVWTPRILAEWRLAAIRDGGALAGLAVEAESALMAARHPSACVTPDGALERGLTLPDPGDLHVLAGAITAGVSTIITLNLRDFPGFRLAPHGLTARHPDGWLWEVLSTDPQAMHAPIRDSLAEVGASAVEEIRAGLKRARLPRLARAFAALSGG